MNASFRNYLLLFLGCVVFHILGTWNLPLIDRDEPRFAEASREMRERQDFIVPYFNGQYRFDKPPFTYWAQAASYSILGENDFAARFPSAIAAGLTAVMLLAWGTRIGTHKTGWWAAIIFTLSLQTFLHAKAAVADMWLVLFMTGAFWAGWELVEGSKRRPVRRSLDEGGTPNAERRTPNSEENTPTRFWWWSFYASLAFAFLAKGPIGLIPLIPVVWMMIRSRGRVSWLHFALGLLLTFAIISLWAVPALIKTHGEFFRIGIGRHVVGRSIGAMEGHGAGSIGLYVVLLPFYFIAVFLSFLPWSYKLPWLFRRVKSQRDATDNYLLLGILSVFGIFTFVATKLPHYTLPAFPLLALLLARHWTSDTARADYDSLVFKRVVIATALVWIAVALILPPIAASHFPSYSLYQKTRDAIRPEMEMASLDYNEPSLVWYFRSRVKGFLTPLRRKKVDEFMSRPGPRLVIVPTEQLNTVFANIPPGWTRVQTVGFNIPKGKTIDLTLMMKPE